MGLRKKEKKTAIIGNHFSVVRKENERKEYQNASLMFCSDRVRAIGQMVLLCVLSRFSGVLWITVFFAFFVSLICLIDRIPGE
jgi:hypothetical protein